MLPAFTYAEHVITLLFPFETAYILLLKFHHINKLAQQKKELDKEVDTLSGEKKELSQAASKLAGEKEELQESVAKLAGEKRELSETASKLAEDKRNLQETVAELADQKKKLVANLDEINKQADSLRAELEGLKDRWRPEAARFVQEHMDMHGPDICAIYEDVIRLRFATSFDVATRALYDLRSDLGAPANVPSCMRPTAFVSMLGNALTGDLWLWPLLPTAGRRETRKSVFLAARQVLANMAPDLRDPARATLMDLCRAWSKAENEEDRQSAAAVLIPIVLRHYPWDAELAGRYANMVQRALSKPEHDTVITLLTGLRQIARANSPNARHTFESVFHSLTSDLVPSSPDGWRPETQELFNNWYMAIADRFKVCQENNALWDEPGKHADTIATYLRGFQFKKDDLVREYVYDQLAHAVWEASKGTRPFRPIRRAVVTYPEMAVEIVAKKDGGTPVQAKLVNFSMDQNSQMTRGAFARAVNRSQTRPSTEGWQAAEVTITVHGIGTMLFDQAEVKGPYPEGNTVGYRIKLGDPRNADDMNRLQAIWHTLPYR